MHPKKLEMDEAQDYPEPGWVELGETLKYGEEDATWRAHGVSRGVRDRYYKQTQPESGWTTHRICLPEGTLIYGVDGPFPIQDAEIGAMVWSVTPEGQLEQRPVLGRIDNGEKATWEVRAKGGYALETTPNHPYLILSREGTKRTRRSLKLEWVEAREIVPGDYIIGVRELDSTGFRVPSVDEVSEMLTAHSPQREVPQWVWSAPRSVQLAFLVGYLMGDGSLAHQRRGQDPWQISSASIVMTKQLRALCHYLGVRASRIATKPNTGGIPNREATDIHTFYAYPDESWFWQIPRDYSAVRDGQPLEGLDKRLVARKVSSSVATGRVVPTYDITVEGLHNYIAEGVVTHNTAMHRPDWTPEEREAKAELYGSRDHPDYRRNILGLHGDAQSSLFVLVRLMACVDQNQNSRYNTEEYAHIRIGDERLKDTGLPIASLLDFPSEHQRYERVWAGCDIGMTNHPTEVLIFGEERGNFGGKSHGEGFRLKLLTRIHLERISAPDQRAVFEAVWDFYRPQAIAMDRTGLGLPIFSEIKEAKIPGFSDAMKGYNFSEKVTIGFEKPEDDYIDPDYPYGTPIMANVLEYSSDMLRLYVDRGEILLPWDIDLLREFQGQTYVINKSSTDHYGRKQFNKGKFHALDGARMAILACRLEEVDRLTSVLMDSDPVLDTFITY